MEVITAPLQSTNTTTVLVMAATGSKYEPKNKGGISHFLEHMFFKGTKKRPKAAIISGILDGVGGEYNAFTSKEYTGFWVKTSADKLAVGMDVLSDMLAGSKFVSAEIAREKGVIIEEINTYLDNPMYRVEDIFETCLYGDTPAGRDVIGTKKTVSNLQRNDLLSYVNSQYGAENLILCAAGKLPHNFGSLAERYFGVLGKGAPCGKDMVKESQKKPELLVHYKKTEQAHISLGVRAFPYGHPGQDKVKFISALLGGSMSSRLFLKLRERQGLAYYVRTSAEFYSDSGYLTTQAGVPVDKLEQAIAIILKEYREIAKRPAGTVEMRKIKDFIKGRITISLEASDNMANWYAKQAVLRTTQARDGRSTKNEFRSPEKFFKAFSAVDSGDILETAKKIFIPENINCAVIGPYRDDKQIRKSIENNL